MSENQEKTVLPSTEDAIEAEEERADLADTVPDEESTLFSAPKEVTAPKGKKKRLVTLLVTLCVLVLLGGGVAAAYFGGLFQQEEETSAVSEAESDEPELPSLVDYSKTGISCIQSLTIKNETGSYSFVKNKDGAMAVKGYEDLPRDAAAIENVLVQYTAVTPDLVIAENATTEQLAACGLDKPTTVSVQYTDNVKLDLLFGRLATGADAGYYAMEKGGTTIWLFREDYFQATMNDKTYYLGKTLMTAPTPAEDDSVGAAKLQKMTISKGNRKDPVTLRYIRPNDSQSAQLNGKYVLEQPFLNPADSDVVNDWDTSLCGLYGATIEAIHPTEAELQKFGLTEPRAVATLTFGIYDATDEEGNTLDTPKWYNEISYTLTLGNRTEEDTYYAIADGIDMVYTVNASTVPWAELGYEDLVSKSLFLRYITELSGINATVNGESYALCLTHGTQKDESGTETATLKATLNKKEVLEGNVRALYESMMSVKRVAAATEDKDTSGVPALSLELVPLTGNPDTSFAFYPYSANRYLCVSDSGDRFLVKASDVESLIPQLKTLSKLSDTTTTASVTTTKPAA